MIKLRDLKGFNEFMPKLPEGKHSGHTFDASWCYKCSETVEDDEIDPEGTNWKYNKAIDQISDVNVVVDEDALVSEISNHFYCNHHSAQSCNCHSKWKECVRIISYKLNRIIRLEKQTIFGMNVKTDDKLKNNEFRLEKSDDK